MGSRDRPAADLPRRLERHLASTGLLRPGGRILVAHSGGLDSTVLLHILRFRMAHWELRLSAGHLDHGMRPGSAADAAWVRGVCRAWRVPFAEDRLEPPPSSEAEARERRYRFLHRAAPRGAIATAHHLDDQAETVLFRAIRGTGLRGLRGIAPRRGRVVRPLLPFTRQELLDYARTTGIAWRDDPTNLDLRLARNRLRHLVLPAMERAHPGTVRILARLAAVARRDEDRWRARTREAASAVIRDAGPRSATLARDVLRSYHPAVRARVLRLVLRRLGSSPGRAGTRAALEFINSSRSGGEVHLPGGVRLQRDFERIRVVRGREHRPADVGLEIEREDGAGLARIGGRRYAVRWGEGALEADSGKGPLEGEGIVIPDSVPFPLLLRGWRPGDRIRLEYGRKKLKKLFAEHRLDRAVRRSIPVLVDAEDRVLWVPGVARARGVRAHGGGFEIAVVDAE
ncbi:MAG TPA: tRNA lysidine(34) synthetase TilS [Longimicrobiales bacterium]|nr:tRNA lysidine(34) synthetase TilS [Longimicrobiales bacterium]